MPSTENTKSPAQPARLGLWDAVSLLIGIVIGASIFRSPPLILKNVTGPWTALLVWGLGGVLSLIGAMCYAELAAAYPRSGGDYVYLRRAFGPWAGFLFGWTRLAVVFSANIGAMAFVFADYALDLWQLPAEAGIGLAVGAVAILTFLNLLGLVLGKWTQNILSLAKVLGLGGLVVAGFAWSEPGAWRTSGPTAEPNFGLAMILVLYSYGGWSDAACVAAELRRRQDIYRALILGTSAVMAIYLAVVAAYIAGLGFDGVRDARAAVAAAVLERPLGPFAAKAMSLLVMISTLGAINGMLFTGSRVFVSLGEDHRLFAVLARWHPRLGSPHWALLALAIISLAMMAMVGTLAGQQWVDRCLHRLGLAGLPWAQFDGGFNTLVTGTAPVFWMFFLMTGLALFALRERDQELVRPFSVPFYPTLPLVFCATCLYMMVAALNYAGYLSLLGFLPLTLGLPLYLLTEQDGRG